MQGRKFDAEIDGEIRQVTFYTSEPAKAEGTKEIEMQSRLIAKAELKRATIYLHNTGTGYAVTTFLNRKPFDRITALDLGDALGSFSELVRREEEV